MAARGPDADKRKGRRHWEWKRIVLCGLALLLIGLVGYEDVRLPPLSAYASTETRTGTKCVPDSCTLRIVDVSARGQSEGPSLEQVNFPHFKAFIAAVTDHVVDAFAETTTGGAPPEETPKLDLVFVRLPLVTSGNEPTAPVPALPTPRSGVTCRLESPWARLMVRHSPRPLVRAVFLWNERQFLVDQVVLSGEGAFPAAQPTPLPSRLFWRYAADYAAVEIPAYAPKPHIKSALPLSELIPADVLWLFRHSWQTDRAPFPSVARNAMQDVVAQAGSAYSDLVSQLFDRCLADGTVEQRYDRNLEHRDIIPLGAYRIERLRLR
jgi:hypothetical protein